jgi:Putative beta-barrel porin 2
MKARYPLIAALAAALLPSQASAQAWVSSSDLSEGIGIRVGNFELHPSLGGEFGYDSNLFRASEEEGVVDVLRLRITPSLTLSTLGKARRNAATPPDVTFAASAYAAYNEIFALDSDESDVAEQRNLGLGADAKLDVFPQRKVGFDLQGAYVRVIDTDGTSDDLASEGFNRDTLRGAAGVTWRPGGGLFEWRGGYGVTYHFFEDEAFDALANLQHEINTRGRWRFLPRSALLFDSSYTFVRYADETTQQTDGDVVRARIGFHGLVTYHLALLGMVGWGASFYERGPQSIAPSQYDSLLANAEVRWFIQPRPDLDAATITSGLSSVALGYTRSFANSYYGSFYQRDRGYLQFSMFLLGAVAGGLEFGVSRVAYPEVDVIQQASFSQLRLDGRLFGEYRFTDTLAANATLQFDQVNSPSINGEDLDYKRWQAYVGVRWFM